MRSITRLTTVLLCSIYMFAQSVEQESRGEGDFNAPTNPVRNSLARQQAMNHLGAGGTLLLIPESTNDRVMAFDSVTGDLIDPDFIPADATNLSTPIHALRHPTTGNILVSDQLEDVVQEYDPDGNYVGIFAPAGGVNNAILDNIRGMGLSSSNTILVTVGGGANDDAVAEFDLDGNYLGNFIANGADGLDSPFDIILRASDHLVGGITSDTIHRYDTSGSALSQFSPINTFPEQIFETSSGNILVANFSGTEEGVVEYNSSGSLVGVYDPGSLGGYRGAYELGNGNILTTNGGGVHEIDRTGALIETKISGVSARFIQEYSTAPPLPPIPTMGQWGLIIMVSSLALGGIWYMRKRRLIS